MHDSVGITANYHQTTPPSAKTKPKSNPSWSDIPLEQNQEAQKPLSAQTVKMRPVLIKHLSIKDVLWSITVPLR